jgi:hypothetical protein
MYYLHSSGDENGKPNEVDIVPNIQNLTFIRRN